MKLTATVRIAVTEAKISEFRVYRSNGICPERVLKFSSVGEGRYSIGRVTRLWGEETEDLNIHINGKRTQKAKTDSPAYQRTVLVFGFRLLTLC